MYTSGTTGDPKGVLISNKSIITIVSAVDEFLKNSNEEVIIHIPMHLLYPNEMSLPLLILILL
jgi:long-subunit acyl-CoA synthetase (AMP-forming)